MYWIFKNLIVLELNTIYCLVFALDSGMLYILINILFMYFFCRSFHQYISLSIWYSFIIDSVNANFSEAAWVHQDYKETENLHMPAIKVLDHFLLRKETYCCLMFILHFGKPYFPPSQNLDVLRRIFFLF